MEKKVFDKIEGAPVWRFSGIDGFNLRFLRRTMFLFAMTTVAFFMLYVFGNYQSFLDATQIVILRWIVGAASLTLLFASATLILQIYFFIRRRQKAYLRLCISSVLCGLLGVIMAFLCTIIIVVSRI